MLFQGIILYHAFIVGATMYLVFCAFCRILIAFTLDLEYSINHFNCLIASDVQNKHSVNQYERIEKNLCEIIQFHAETKQFVGF